MCAKNCVPEGRFEGLERKLRVSPSILDPLVLKDQSISFVAFF